jgi:CHAT domain-containing protein
VQPGTRLHVKQMLQRDEAKLICLVAHGYLDPHQHRASGLLLGGEQSGIGQRDLPLYGGRLVFYDLPLVDMPAALRLSRPAEVLSLRELETIASHAELTMLLACSAGTAHVLQTDEPASLAEALVRAGSATVIAPLWESRLDLTAEWTGAFVDAWALRGMPKALAAREAYRTLDCGGAVASLGGFHMRGDWA